MAFLDRLLTTKSHHDKHVQLGTDMSADNRALLSDPDDIDAVWEDVTTVEDFKRDIETLREAGWPVGN